jgi:hypothetical protein
LVQSGSLLATEALESVAAAKAIAPFVNEQTLAIVHVDARRFDVPAAVASLGKLVPAAAGELAEAEEAQATFEQFRKAGGRELFVVFNLAETLESSCFFVVPLADGADESTLAAALGEFHFDSHRTLHDALVFGSDAALERLANQRSVARPDVARAFEAAGNSAAQVIVVPTADTRRVVEELLPTLPGEMGGGPSKTLTRGALWAVLSVDTTQGLSASLTLQSQNRDAAAALRKQWAEAYEQLGRRAEITAALPSFNQVAAKFMPDVRGDKLVLSIDERNQGAEVLRAVIAAPLQAARAANQRSQSVSNLKQLALAMHLYHDVHGHLPAAASYTADGKPLLSWRVQLLPYVGEENLYRKFHHDEPWDSEHNKALIEHMPAVFRSPQSQVKSPGRTTYLVAIGEGTVFDNRQGTALREMTDGTSNTILIVECDDDRAEIWTRPDDLKLDLDQPQAGLVKLPGDMFLTALADGSVHAFSHHAEAEQLRRAFLKADGKPVDYDKLKGQ